MENNNIEGVLIFSALSLILRSIISRGDRRRRRRNRNMWVRNRMLLRDTDGAYNRLIPELELHDREGYFKYVEINNYTFLYNNIS